MLSLYFSLTFSAFAVLLSSTSRASWTFIFGVYVGATPHLLYYLVEQHLP